MSVTHEDNFVELEVGVRAGLMNRRDDCLSFVACQLSQELDDCEGTETIEARGGLVKEQHGGVSDELDSDCGSLPLSTRDNLAIHVADLGRAHILQTQLRDQLVYSLVLSIQWGVELEAGCKLEALFDSKV